MEKKNEFYENLIKKTYNKTNDSFGAHKSCFINNNLAVLKTPNRWVNFKPSEQQIMTSRLKSLGFKTPSIHYFSKKRDYYYEIQEKAKGHPIFYTIYSYANQEKSPGEIERINRNKFLEYLSMPTSEYVDFVESFTKAYKLGLMYDCHCENVFYDEKEGFTFIDLPQIPFQSLKSLKENFKDFNDIEDFENYVDCLTLIFDDDWCKGIISEPYRTLINHKFLEAIEQSSLNFNKQNLKQIKDFLLDKSPCVCCDYDLKLTLIKIGILKDHQEEANYIDNCDKNDSWPSYQESYKCKWSNECLLNGIDIPFLEQCLEHSTIQGIPAIDYISNIQAPKFEDENIEDMEFSENKYLEEQIDSNQNNYDEEIIDYPFKLDDSSNSDFDEPLPF